MPERKKKRNFTTVTPAKVLGWLGFFQLSKDKLAAGLRELGVNDPGKNMRNWFNQPKLVNQKHLSKRLDCLLYTSPSPRDRQKSRMPSSA